MKFQTLRSLAANAFKKSRHVRRIVGKSVLSQAVEMFRLRLLEGKILPHEYYKYELYNDRLFSFSAKRDFIGGRAAVKLYKELNSIKWNAIARDKIIFYTLMRGLGVPIPKLYALYSGSHVVLNDVSCITELDVMTDFIRHKMSYPFFGKPIRGAHGFGAVAVESFDKGNEELVTRTGERIRLCEFLINLEYGYLFQECLVPHSAISEICGATLSTLRMIVFLSDGGARLLHVIWRIPRFSKVTDSYVDGTSGNLIGQVDVDTGQVVQVLQGVAPYSSLTRVHPDSGKTVTGITLPNWESTVKVCLNAATLLPELRLQSWDVAICPDGPILIEVNDHGGLNIVQYACRRGFRDKELRNSLGL